MKSNKIYIYLFIILILLYLASVLLVPTDPAVLEKYQLTQSKARLLGLTVTVPIIAIWLFALYGFMKFKDYAEVVKDTKEGKAFKTIATGLALLALSLPVVALIVSLLNYVAATDDSMKVEVTIIRNYVRLIFPMIAILIISRGAEQLIKTVSNKKVNVYPKNGILVMIVLSSVFTWLVTTRPYDAAGDVAYYLPNWLVVFTLAIPYLFIWAKGILASYQLIEYKNKIGGVLYKKALDYLAKGIAAIILLSIATQILTTLSVRLNRLDLTPILLIVYVLVAFNVLGYALVARGASRLKQIEEV